jgi:hypothetical protein
MPGTNQLRLVVKHRRSCRTPVQISLTYHDHPNLPAGPRPFSVWVVNGPACSIIVAPRNIRLGTRPAAISPPQTFVL